MRFTVEHSDNIVIFELKNPSLSSDISAKLKAELLILCQPNIKAFIFDLSHVEYIDSSGLGALLLAHRQLTSHSIPIGFVSVQDSVRSLLNISHIDDLFEFFDNVEEALSKYE